MKRLLLVMGFVALFSLAASAKTPSTTYNFQFLTVNGDPYCDGMFLNNYGNPQVLVDGFHSDPYCAIELGIGYIPSFGVNGFVTTVASNYQYGGGSGNVMVVSDPAIALEECEVAFFPQPNHSTSDVFCTEPPAALIQGASI